MLPTVCVLLGQPYDVCCIKLEEEYVNGHSRMQRLPLQCDAFQKLGATKSIGVQKAKRKEADKLKRSKLQIARNLNK